jgi:hypothetical protein
LYGAFEDVFIGVGCQTGSHTSAAPAPVIDLYHHKKPPWAFTSDQTQQTHGGILPANCAQKTAWQSGAIESKKQSCIEIQAG